MTHFAKYIFITAILVLGVSACAPSGNLVSEESEQIEGKDNSKTNNLAYLKNILKKAPGAKNNSSFQPEDKIRISVLGEEEISGDYQVSESGEITMPLIGTFNVLGYGADEIKDLIVRRLQDGFIKDPFVKVSIIEEGAS